MSIPKFIKLGKITKLISSGATPLGGSRTYLPAGPVIFLRSQNVRMGHLDLTDVAYISEEADHAIRRTRVENGDVLLNITGASIGRVASFDLHGLKANVNQHVCVIRPIKERLHSQYLVQYFATPQFQRKIDQLQNGGTRQALTFSKIADFDIPHPPLAEQKRIATILDKADAIRRKRQAAIKLADDFLRATFLDMFGDPVTNPNGWKVKELRELVKLQGGYAFKSTEYVHDGVPLVRIGNANKGEFDFNNLAFLPESFINRYNKFILRPGDLVITLTGTVGKEDYGNIVVIPEGYDVWLLNQRVAKIIIFDPNLLSGYLSFFLKNPSVKNNIIKNSRGIRQANLNNEDILSQKIQLPTIEKQKIFESIIGITEESVRKMQLFKLSAEKSFNSLTQRAFQGGL